MSSRDLDTDHLFALLGKDADDLLLRNLRQLFAAGRLGGTGCVSIFPVEHSAAASLATNPAYFDPADLVELAIEGGCHAVGVLGALSRCPAHRIPFIGKLNDQSSGRRPFSRPTRDGVARLHPIQDVYADPDVSAA